MGHYMMKKAACVPYKLPTNPANGTYPRFGGAGEPRTEDVCDFKAKLELPASGAAVSNGTWQ